jgi:hypothetical protein
MSATILLVIDRLTMKWDAMSTDERQSLPVLRSVSDDPPTAIAQWPSAHKELYLHSYSDLSFVESHFISRLYGWKVQVHVKWQDQTLLYKGFAKSFGKSKLNGQPTLALCVEMSEEVAA